MFVDVILPLPLDGLFTYSVPQPWGGQVKIGIRVLVPFGRNKTYVGIVAKTHKGPLPEGVHIKDILQVIDVEPVLLDSQLRLWQWIAEYYMSPIGEVYKAALPSGLKAEEGYKPRTETYLRLTSKFSSEQALHVALDMLQRAPKQLKALVDFINLSDSQSDTEISRDELLNQGHTLQTINSLQKRSILDAYEKEVGRLNHGGA